MSHLPQLHFLPFVGELGEAEGAVEEAAKKRGFRYLLLLYYGVLHFDPFVYQAKQGCNLPLLEKGGEAERKRLDFLHCYPLDRRPLNFPHFFFHHCEQVV